MPAKHRTMAEASITLPTVENDSGVTSRPWTTHDAARVIPAAKVSGIGRRQTAPNAPPGQPPATYLAFLSPGNFPVIRAYSPTNSMAISAPMSIDRPSACAPAASTAAGAHAADCPRPGRPTQGGG